MKPIFLFSFLILFTACTALEHTAYTPRHALMHEGDLLFCIAANDNAITEVTEGTENLNIDHVAIAHYMGKRLYALEAVHRGVVLTPIDSFMDHRRKGHGVPQVIVARLTDTTGIRRSVNKALRYLGKPYDFNFMPDDSALYCSELVQKCYVDGQGRAIFAPIPMSFHDRNGHITPYWSAHYARQGLTVPEGKPGSNPGQLSRSKALTIVHRFYKRRQ
ncbi:MAG TPA: YiiX/YebB-like N1pC/P60 family cysteine hydrolase [Prevotella sp.]